MSERLEQVSSDDHTTRESLVVMQRRGMARAMGVTEENIAYYAETGYRSPAEYEQTVAEATYAENIAAAKEAELQREAAEAGNVATTLLSAGALSRVNPELAPVARLTSVTRIVRGMVELDLPTDRELASA